MLPWQEKRDILVKTEAETDPSLGEDPNNRSAQTLLRYGTINLNKPKGPTSHLAVAYIKDILHIPKAGHGGSLDPAVTGVLPVATDRATRIMRSLLSAGKEYICLMHLHGEIPEAQIRKAAEEFKGTITQLPPVKSAVKRRLRQRNIYYLDFLEINKRDILFRMGCQAGTYVRKVCHDFGLKLKVGAHMAELVRTKAGPFTEDNWVTLQDLEDAYAYYQEGNETFLRHCIKPPEWGVRHLPHIWIQDKAVDTICHGATLKVPGIVRLHDHIEPDQLVAVMTLKNELVCIGKSTMTSKRLLEETKGVAVKTDVVLLPPVTYKKV